MYATNIESHGGECPDCEHLERKLDKERGRHQQEVDSYISTINTLNQQLSDLQEENERLKASNRKLVEWLDAAQCELKKLKQS